MADQSPTRDIVATLFCHAPTLAAARADGNQDSTEGTGHPLINALVDLVTKLANTRFKSITKVLHAIEAGPRVLEVTISFATPIAIATFRKNAAITNFETANNVEVVFQRSTIYRKYKRLAVFDMDSTLIQQEVIDLIAAKIGVEPQVSAITARAMNGELDFTASLRERCALLKGVPATVFEELRGVISLTPGVADLIRALKRLGFKTAVLSGGFTPLARWQADQLGLDYVYANHLVVSPDGATLTGELEGTIVHAEQKRTHVIEIAAREGISLDQVMAVGDGANDLPMMGVAGLGVAFNAKPKVQLEAPAKLNSPTLLDVLYLLGLAKVEIDELIR